MNAEQKDTLAKFTYDLARIVAGAAVIKPLVQRSKSSILNTLFRALDQEPKTKQFLCAFMFFPKIER